VSCIKNNTLRPLMLLAHGRIPPNVADANKWKFDAFWFWYDHRGRHKHKFKDDQMYNTLKCNKLQLTRTYAWIAFDQWCNHYRRWQKENDIKQLVKAEIGR